MLVCSACTGDPETYDGPFSATFAAKGNCGGEPQAPQFGSGIDELARYDGADSCDPTPKPGVVAFRDYIMATYPCTADYGISRECDSGGTSEHHEGRAWDWGTTPSIQASQDLLSWLLATDEHGNKYAMARRFGIMYMIFDNQIWEAYRAERGWRAYSGSNPHTDHVHFSFSWDGARKKTSFWTGSTGPSPDGGSTKPDSGPQPTNQNFIGAPCSDTNGCSNGLCFAENGDLFKGGMCSEPCDMHCPDKDGEPTTYCIAFDPAQGKTGGNDGYCFTGCDTSRFSGNGCREGYSCVKLARHNMPDSIRSICVPQASGSTPPPTPPEPTPPPTEASDFIGSGCSSDSSCSTGLCFVEDGDLFKQGMCSDSCDQICPDQEGAPETFCVAYDPSTTSFMGDEGYCFSRCDKTRYPGTGCRTGYTCAKMERHNDSWVQRNVCIPEQSDEEIAFMMGGAPPDAEGDLPNPEKKPLSGGCSLGPTTSSGIDLGWMLLLMLALGWRRR
jgi:MYXO-CTERM domain-containing protein